MSTTSHDDLMSTNETAILERVVLSQDAAESEQTARSLLALRFSSADQVRMEQLAAKARAGSLSPEEEREIENYERVGHYLAILQSKARMALRGSSAP